MMKFIISVAMLLILAGTALGTMWLYDDPTFFQVQTPSQSSAFKQASVPTLEIFDAPYFLLPGQGFYRNAIPVNLTDGTNTINIGSNGVGASSPVSTTFGGHLEDNLKYAQSKSSMRVGQQGSWTTLNTPGVL